MGEGSLLVDGYVSGCPVLCGERLCFSRNGGIMGSMLSFEEDDSGGLVGRITVLKRPPLRVES